MPTGGSVFARLCRPTAGRRWRPRPPSHQQGDSGCKSRRHSWGSGENPGAAEECEGAAGGGATGAEAAEGAEEWRPREDHSCSSSSDEEDDQWPKSRRRVPPSLDLLATCLNLEHTGELEECSETESEPAPSCLRDPGDLEQPGMGQRASSTSSLHHRAAPPLPSRVSLTWALLGRKQPTPGVHRPVPLIVSTRRCSPARSNGGRAAARARACSPQGPPTEAVEPPRPPEPPQIRPQAPVPVQQAEPQAPRQSRAESRASRASRASSGAARSIKFGYDIHDVDEFLSKASLQSPANIPVVLCAASVLYQPGARRGRSGRGSWRQSELSLPLGMVVNAVFRTHSWLYVHTPHGEAGYVRYRSCLPLGILPHACETSPGAWDSPDAFPPPPPPSSHPHRSRRGAASVCEVRHRRANKTDTEKLRDTVSESGGRRHRRHSRALRPEEAVDRLFLASQGSRSESRAESQRPVRVQSSLATRTVLDTLLKDTEWGGRRRRPAEDSGDTVSVRDSVSQCGGGSRYRTKPSPIIPDPADEDLKTELKSLCTPEPTYPEQNLKQSPYSATEQLKILASYHFSQQLQGSSNKLPSYRTVAQQTDMGEAAVEDSRSEVGPAAPREVRARDTMSEAPARHHGGGSRSRSRAETLLLIRSDYSSRGRNTLSVRKGDVVVLVSAKLKDWFWVRRGDGCEGFIPAVVAGHGFL